MNQPLPAALRVHADDIAGGFAEMQVAERGHFKAEAAQPRELARASSRRCPAGERGGNGASRSDCAQRRTSRRDDPHASPARRQLLAVGHVGRGRYALPAARRSPVSASATSLRGEDASTSPDAELNNEGNVGAVAAARQQRGAGVRRRLRRDGADDLGAARAGAGSLLARTDGRVGATRSRFEIDGRRRDLTNANSVSAWQDVALPPAGSNK